MREGFAVPSKMEWVVVPWEVHLRVACGFHIVTYRMNYLAKEYLGLPLDSGPAQLGSKIAAKGALDARPARGVMAHRI